MAMSFCLLDIELEHNLGDSVSWCLGVFFWGRSGYRRRAFRYIFFRCATKGCRSNP